MRRHAHWILYALLLLLLGGAGFVVWLTYHPESSHWEKLVRLPGVGPGAERLREAYRPAEPQPSPDEPAAASEPIDLRWAQAEWTAVREREAEAQVERLRARAFRWFRPGVSVRVAPDPEAAVRLTLEAPRRFTFLEESDGWARVRVEGEDGWIPVSAETVMTEPPLGREAAPVLPVPGQPAAPRLLAAAREVLEPVLEGAVGAYPLLTDVDDGVLHRALDVAARQVEAAYPRRYGLDPQHSPAATVILFRHEGAYRRFQAGEARLAGLNPRGHTGHGIVALYRGGQPDDEVVSTLLHELIHLLNRRALGPALPPWLDEGMAEDVSLSARDATGAIDFTRLGGGKERTGTTAYRLRLGHGSLERLRRVAAAGDLVPLETLVAMDWESFVQPGRQEDHYAQSAFLVRYLLDDPGLAPRFRRFLGQVAQGTPLTPATLQRALQREWARLDAGFQSYLAGEFRRTLAPSP